MSEQHTDKRELLSHSELLQFKRWNTPTIYNGWEQITKHDASRDGFNLEPTEDFMPQMGPMIGYAVTVVCEPSNAQHRKDLPDAVDESFRYSARSENLGASRPRQTRHLRLLLGRSEQQPASRARLCRHHHRRRNSRRRRNGQRRLQSPRPSTLRRTRLFMARPLGLRSRSLWPNHQTWAINPCRQARFSCHSDRRRTASARSIDLHGHQRMRDRHPRRSRHSWQKHGRNLGRLQRSWQTILTKRQRKIRQCRGVVSVSQVLILIPQLTI